MKKINNSFLAIVTVFCLAALVLALSACSVSEKGDSSSSKASSKADVTSIAGDNVQTNSVGGETGSNTTPSNNVTPETGNDVEIDIGGLDVEIDMSENGGTTASKKPIIGTSSNSSKVSSTNSTTNRPNSSSTSATTSTNTNTSSKADDGWTGDYIIK